MVLPLHNIITHNYTGIIYFLQFALQSCLLKAFKSFFDLPFPLLRTLLKLLTKMPHYDPFEV
jgi:hypothetical protein